MWSRRGFGVVLDAENRQLAVPHPFQSAVVEIDVRRLQVPRHTVDLDGETVTTHEEVLEAGEVIVPRLTALIRGVLRRL